MGSDPELEVLLELELLLDELELLLDVVDVLLELLELLELLLEVDDPVSPHSVTTPPLPP